MKLLLSNPATVTAPPARRSASRLDGLDVGLCLALVLLALVDMGLWVMQDFDAGLAGGFSSGFPPVLPWLALLWCGILLARLPALAVFALLLSVTVVAWL